VQIMAVTDAIRQVASADFPTEWGHFLILGFERDFREAGWPRRETAVALIMGDMHQSPLLVRIHSQCLTGDVFHSLRCDCGAQLNLSLSKIAEEGAGILIYEEQEGRGIGLIAKLQAYELQDQGFDTVEANEKLGLKSEYRDYVLPVAILNQLGIGTVRLITNNPEKVEALERAGIKVTERVPCEVVPGPSSVGYLTTKKEKLGQLLSLV
jgi:GTP cyclohydrolase II